MHFGHIIPPPPVTYACAVAPDFGLPGRPRHGDRHGDEPEPEEDRRPTPGPRPAARSPAPAATANVDTKGVAPGTYTVKGHVSRGHEARPDGGLLGRLHGQAVRAADHQLLGQPLDGRPRWFLDHHCDGHEPAESSSDLQLQRFGWQRQRHDQLGNPVDLRRSGGTTITVTCNVVDDNGKTATRR